MNRTLVHAFLETTRAQGFATSYAFTPSDMFGRPELLVGQPKVASADVLGLLRHARDRNLVLGRIERSGTGRALVRVGESSRRDEFERFVRQGLSGLVPWLENAVFVGLYDPDPDFETDEEEKRRLLLRELEGLGAWDQGRARRVYQLSSSLGEVAESARAISKETGKAAVAQLKAIDGGLRGFRESKGKRSLGELLQGEVPIEPLRSALSGGTAKNAAPLVKAATGALLRCAGLVNLLQPQLEDPDMVDPSRRNKLLNDLGAARTLASELTELLRLLGGGLGVVEG